ncbi:MAG: redoxin domain-containing protein [Planctomycetes bacterium]|nr:redoxin domain-containing protein [Planctomycetota bacterium]
MIQQKTPIGFLALALVLAAAPLAAQEVELEVGQKAPDFTLPTIDGGEVTLSKLCAEKPTVVMFWCPSCPTVVGLEERINGFATANKEKIHFVAVASNREDTVEALKKLDARKDYPFTILRDEGNAVADKYGAQVTPHCYLVDKEGVVRYIGNLVSRRAAGGTLQRFVDALLAGSELPAIDRTCREYG